MKRLLTFALFALSAAFAAQPATAAIAVVASASNTNAAGNSVTISNFTVASGLPGDTYLLVGVSMHTPGSVSTISWNGSTTGFALVGGVTNNRRVEMWALQNPTAATANIVVTATSGVDEVVAGAVLVSGVNPGGVTSALRVVSGANRFVTNSATSSTAATPTFTTAAGDLVMDAVSATNDGGTDTPASGQTKEWGISNGTSGDVSGDGSVKPIASGTTTTTSWAMSISNAWAIVAVSVIPNPAPTITKSFNPTTIQSGGTSLLTLTITNPNIATTLTGVADTDTLPAGMTYSGTPATTCTSGVTTGSTTTKIVLSGASITAGASCTVTATVTSSTPGVSTNTTGTVSSTNGGTGLTATATLTVIGPAAKLAFTVSPSNSTAGVAFGTQPVVALEDASGNIVTGTAQNVQLTIQNNVGSGTLSGTTTVAVNTSTGLATFSGLSINKSGTGYTLTAAGTTVNTSPGTIISGSFNITANTASQLVYTTPPSTPDNGGSAFGTQPSVSIEDSFGNVVTTATNSITLAIGTNPVGGTLTCTSANPLPAVAGVATFVGCSINKAGVGYSLTAAATGLSGTTSGSITIQVGPANKLVFGVSPSGAQAGATISPAVTVLIQDLGGNLTTSTATVALGIATGTGTLTGGAGIPAVNGTATFSGLSINKTGAFTLQATSTGLSPVTSGSFTITPGTATQLAFTTNPSNSTGGVAFGTQPQVTLQDANNNTVTGVAQNVTLAIQTNPSSGTLSGTTTVAVNTGTGIATFSGLSIDKAGNGYTLTATGSTVSLTAGVVLSGSFNITVGAANKLGFTIQPGGGTGGVAWSQQPVVALQDAGGNTVTGVAQTVTASIQTNAGPGGTLAGTTAVTLNTGTGLATFTNLSINKIGNGYTLTVKGSTINTTAGVIISSPFNITVGTATQMVFGQQPTTTQAAATMSPAVTVLLEDAGGNLTTSSASVTVAFGTNTVGGTLSGTLSQAASSGTASFGDLSVNKTATNYTLTAASTGLTTITSNAFTITAGTATQLVFTTQPGGGTGGSNFTTQPTVSVEDANNNVVTTGANSTASITLAIGTNAGPGGTLTCTTNPRSAVAGVDTFAGCKIDVAGNGYTLTAAAAGLTGATSNPFNITVGTATKLQIGVQPSNTQDTVAINPAVTVQILDAGGNLTTSTASVTFAIGTNAGPGGVLSGGGATPAVAGTATFSNLSINKIGTGYTLTATSGGLTSATTNPFNITIGPATKLGFSVQPVSTNNHTTITPSVVVQVQDAGGNFVSTATDSITVAIGTNPSAGTLSGTLTQPTSGGASTFNDLSIDNVGTNYTLTASDGGTFTAATSATFNITAGPASQLIFTTEPSATAVPGGAFTIQPVVTVEDPFNNVVTGSTASITLAIGFNAGPGGVLTCTTNPKAAVAGVDAFAGCKINLVGNGYTLTASASGLTGATSTPINVTLGNAKQVTDQASSSCSTASGTTCTITLNLSGVTSSNNVLLVGISNPSTTAVSTVKWGGASGAALTQVPGCAATETNTSSAHFEIWSITNPNLNPTPDTVVITFGSAQTIYAGAALFSNVASLGTCVTSTGTAGTGSVTLAVSQAGGAGFDTASITSFNSGSGSITTPAGQTNLWALNGTAPAAGAGSYAPATGTSLTMTETFNYAFAFRQAFAYGAVPLNPVKTSGRRGQVIVGSLFPEEKPQPDIFHLGDSTRSQSTSPSSTTNPPSPSTDRDANPSAIISKRDD